MAKFLETHQNVMLEYLGSADGARVVAAQPQALHHGGNGGHEDPVLSEKVISSVSPASSVVACLEPVTSVAPVTGVAQVVESLPPAAMSAA